MRKIKRGQVGGDHYEKMPLDVIHFCMVNNIGFCEGNVIKYVCRFRQKNGIEDLKKARNYLDRIIENETTRKTKSKVA